MARNFFGSLFLWISDFSPVPWHFVKSRFHCTTVCAPCIKPVKYITFLRHTITNKNRNDFLHVFVYFEYKWRNIYSGVNICGNLSSFCGAFFLRIAGWKIRTRQNFVPHGSCDQFNISALQVLQGISSLCLIRRLFIAKRSLYKVPSLYKNSDVHAEFLFILCST